LGEVGCVSTKITKMKGYYRQDCKLCK